MRLSLLASILGVLALGATVASPGPATAAKSKMGCDRATEVWDATAGKCKPGSPKKAAVSAKQPAKKAPAKKAPAAK
jgi:hypothetical protein